MEYGYCCSVYITELNIFDFIFARKQEVLSAIN